MQSTNGVPVSLSIDCVRIKSFENSSLDNTDKNVNNIVAVVTDAMMLLLECFFVK